jgi:hypothetical protein
LYLVFVLNCCLHGLYLASVGQQRDVDKVLFGTGHVVIKISSYPHISSRIPTSLLFGIQNHDLLESDKGAHYWYPDARYNEHTFNTIFHASLACRTRVHRQQRALSKPSLSQRQATNLSGKRHRRYAIRSQTVKEHDKAHETFVSTHH